MNRMDSIVEDIRRSLEHKSRTETDARRSVLALAPILLGLSLLALQVDDPAQAGSMIVAWIFLGLSTFLAATGEAMLLLVRKTTSSVRYEQVAALARLVEAARHRPPEETGIHDEQELEEVIERLEMSRVSLQLRELEQQRRISTPSRILIAVNAVLQVAGTTALLVFAIANAP